MNCMKKVIHSFKPLSEELDWRRLSKILFNITWHSSQDFSMLSSLVSNFSSFFSTTWQSSSSCFWLWVGNVLNCSISEFFLRSLIISIALFRIPESILQLTQPFRQHRLVPSATSLRFLWWLVKTILDPWLGRTRIPLFGILFGKRRIRDVCMYVAISVKTLVNTQDLTRLTPNTRSFNRSWTDWGWIGKQVAFLFDC